MRLRAEIGLKLASWLGLRCWKGGSRLVGSDECTSVIITARIIHKWAPNQVMMDMSEWRWIPEDAIVITIKEEKNRDKV